MSDYSPISVSEMDVRNFVSPPLDYDDVTTAEILLKIESVETWVKRKYFEGGSIPSDGRIAVLLMIMPNLLSTATLAKKYCTLNSETLGDYSYRLSSPMGTKDVQSNPFIIQKTWHQMALEILHDLSADKKYQIRISNE